MTVINNAELINVSNYCGSVCPCIIDEEVDECVTITCYPYYPWQSDDD